MAWAAIPNASPTNFWSSSRRSTKFWFGGLKTSVWILCFEVVIDWVFTHFLRKTAIISSRFSGIVLFMFLNVYSSSLFMWVRKWFGSAVLSHLDVHFQIYLENVFKQVKLLCFPFKRGDQWVWQLGNLANAAIEVCRNAIVCQLLKGQQNWICFDRRTGVVFTAEIRPTWWLSFLLFAWTRSRGAVCKMLLNSRHLVVGVIWARASCSLTLKDTRFRKKISLWVVLLRSFVCA